ncbi:MAG: cellulase family glycosylhydrolase [Paludibacteraceae bacterium]|nr:cellulase family glycosylhydrolase [Paludibacteraceae bacterium]
MKKLFTLVSLLLAFAFSANALEGLKLVGNQLCTESGKPIQLRGWSTHGSWFKHCYDDEGDFAAMKNEGANMARIAMYINEGEGINESWVKSCIDFCANQGLYCIVDWHVLRDREGDGSKGNPMDMVGQAKSFFQNITSYVQQKNYNHVLYELCNEPNYNIEGDPYELGRDYVWGWIKEYCNQILPIIKNGDSDAIVLVGTPQWDQAVVFPFLDPIDEMGLNVMYSFHYYAGDQERYLGLLSSAAAFIPLFVTEWGLSSHTGDSGCDTKSADKLMSVCNGKNLGGQIISWANWSWADKGETSGTFTGGGYNNKSWSEAGNYIKNQLKKGDNFSFSESSAYDGAQVFDGVNDFYLELEKFDKGGNYNAYYDFDEGDWIPCSPLPCNAGAAGMYDGVRGDDYVDVGYTNEDHPEDGYFNLGYIGQGEWVKYTIDVKHPGDYEFETYTTNHIDYNIIAFTVDGKNALVDENGNEINRALELQPSKGGTKDGGYNDWGWTTPKCPYAQNKKFRLRFNETGEHKLGIVFMSSCSGLGSLKIIGDPSNGVDVDDVNNQVVSLWPNPSEDGSLNISVNCDADVTIFNIQGVAVYTGKIAAGVSKIDASLASGVYYVTVQSENGISTEKFTVK